MHFQELFLHLQELNSCICNNYSCIYKNYSCIYNNYSCKCKGNAVLDTCVTWVCNRHTVQVIDWFIEWLIVCWLIDWAWPSSQESLIAQCFCIQVFPSQIVIILTQTLTLITRVNNVSINISIIFERHISDSHCSFTWVKIIFFFLKLLAGTLSFLVMFI